jgi:hypothetical protein
MNGTEIERMIQSDEYLSKMFLGVFARDQLPKSISRRPSCLIANTDKSDRPGQHWVAFYFDCNGVNEYFDSYGIKPMFTEFRHLLSIDTNKKKINDTRLQAKNSATCGLYCVFYLFHRCKLSSMEPILRIFDTDYNHNDSIICRFAVKMFNFRHDVCQARNLPINCQSCVTFEY